MRSWATRGGSGEQELVARLPKGARVLELGCGAGVPDTQRLAARFQLTGVDVSR